MRRILAMQVQVIRRAVIGFEHRQILLVQMTVDLVSRVQGKEQGVVGVVRVEDEHGAEIEGVVAGNGGQIRVEQVVFFFVELGVVNVEGFVKIGARRFYFRQVLVVDHDGQGVAPKVVSLDFKFLERLSQIVNLRFLGLINENIIAALGLVRRGGVACKRAFGVVKVSPARMNEAPALGRVLLLPLTAKEIVGFDFEEPLENKGKALRGWVFERQHLHVVIVNAEESSVALDVGFAEVVVEERVASEPCVFNLQGREIQDLLQNAERFVFRQNARAYKVANLSDKAACSGMQRRQRLVQLTLNQHHLFAGGN